MELHHPLLIEFSEHRDLIRRLREERKDFRSLADEYHAIDRRVCRIERFLEPASEAETETLKKQRLRLKDLIYSELRKAATQWA